MALPNAAAYKQSNYFLEGSFIPYYSTISYVPAYAGSGATAATFPNLGAGYGSTTWRNGIEIGGTANGSSNQTVYYSIYSDTYTQGITSSANSLPVVWGVTAGQTTTDILNVVNRLPAMYPITKHTTYSDASNWLINNGYFLANRNYPEIMYDYSNNPMILAFDPSFSASYPLTGSAIYELTGNSSANGLIMGSAAWDSTNKNSIIFTGGYVSLPQPLFSNYVFETFNSEKMTVSIWFYLNSLPLNNTIATLFELTDDRSGTTSRQGSIPQSNQCWMDIFVNSFGDIYFEGDPQCASGTITSPAKINSTPITTAGWHNITVGIDFMISSNNISLSADGGNIISTSYSWLSPGKIDKSPNGKCLIGSAAVDSNGAQLANTNINGKIGAFYIYQGDLTTNQKKDIYPKCLPIYP